MSSSGKWIMWIVIILIVLGGGYWYFSHKSQPAVSPTEQSQNQAVNTTNNTAPQPGSLSTASADNSDAALDQDTATVDANMKGLNSDNAAVDSGLNDQPIQQ